MSKLKIKPEFEKKLKGVKRKYIKNVNAYRCDDCIDYINQLSKHKTFHNFMWGSFVFKKTPEGHDFWIKISKR